MYISLFVVVGRRERGMESLTSYKGNSVNKQQVINYVKEDSNVSTFGQGLLK